MSHVPSVDSLVDGISDWLRCESFSRDLPALRSMAQRIAADARQAGLGVTLLDVDAQTGPALLISNRAPGDERPGVLLLAHYDTVHPAGTVTRNPVRVEQGRLYGPGGYDMKAGTYLALRALGELAGSGGTALPVDFLIVPDEEIGSPWSRPLIEAQAARARYCLVSEPARANGGRCVTARKGTGFIEIAVRGRPSHAGVAHEKGRSAIRELARQILALESMTDYASGITVNIGTAQGGTARNVVPAEASAVGEFRIPDPEAGARLIERIQALRPVGEDVEVDIDVRINRPPMPRSEGTAALLARAQGWAMKAGFVLEEAPQTGGGSDANFVAALGVPTLDGLGAEGDGAHTLKEFVFVESLPRRYVFWREMLRELD